MWNPIRHGGRPYAKADLSWRHYVLKTLIVDDESITRKVLREDLESIRDVEVGGEVGRKGRRRDCALEYIAAQKSDLVLLDLQMPSMSGLEVVRNLKHGSHMPVIVMVTAYERHALESV